MITCKKCNENYNLNINFCSKCGSNLSRYKPKDKTLDLIIAFYLTIMIFIASSYFVFKAYPENLFVDITIEFLFIIIVLGYSFFDLKSIKKLYLIPKINFKTFFLYTITPLFTGLTVYFLVEEINGLLNEENSNILLDYVYLDNHFLWSIFFVAILPPIFEELAFRGYLFNLLEKIVSEKSTIIATAFLFALIHISLISILWIFPFGLLLGYLRKRYNTLWIPMLVHFIHNFTVLILDYYFYNDELLNFLQL